MIYLTQNTVNNVVVTATENVTLNGTSFFLFEFISGDELTPIYFTTEDISPNKCRYNQFNIQLVDSTSGLINPLIGIINLEINGYYKYNIYQQLLEDNLDPFLADGIVENGKVYVQGIDKPIISSYTANDNNGYTAYQ